MKQCYGILYTISSILISVFDLLLFDFILNFKSLNPAFNTKNIRVGPTGDHNSIVESCSRRPH